MSYLYRKSQCGNKTMVRLSCTTIRIPILVRYHLYITDTKILSFWRNLHHWLHWKLSKWQLSVQSLMKISSKWQHFRFSDIESVFLAQYLWRGTKVLDDWLLGMLPQSEGHELNPCKVHNNFSVPLWVICISLCQSIKNQYNKYVYCQSQGTVQN